MAWMRRHRAIVECSAAAVLLWLVLRVAWMSDDGLINVRAALNLAHGNGAGFNVGERVQAFTSPLWFGLEYAVGRVTGAFIVSAILLGAACAVAAVVVLARRSRSLLHAVFVCAAFALSTSWIDYATGGLENGLAMLTVVTLLVCATGLDARWWTWLVCGLAASAVVLTRYDHVLLVVPVMVVLGVRAWRLGRPHAAALVAGAVVPFLAWSGLSWVYFGSLVPNTFAAKTNVEIARVKLLGAGLNYLWVAVWSDPVLTLVLVLATVAGALVGSSLQRAVVAGVVLFVAYVVWIGGDFMAGRFLTTPAIAALWVLAGTDVPTVGRLAPQRVGRAALAAVLVLGVVPMGILRPSRTSGERWALTAHHGVADEAAVWRERGWTLWAALTEDDEVAFEDAPTAFPDMGALMHLEDEWRPVDPAPSGVARPVLVMCGGLGGFGMASGPGVFVIDQCALTDAFLAELPWRMPPSGFWRVGHWGRDLPAGYEDAVRFADPSYVQDPVLRARLVSLWSRIR